MKNSRRHRYEPPVSLSGYFGNFDDALHVALASVKGIPYLLSWNFKHLVKVKTRRMVALANALADYSPVEIIAPPEL